MSLLNKSFLALVALGLACSSKAQITQCLIDKGIANPNCTSIGDPYIDNSCFAGIERQIARSINAEGITDWNKPAPCWGMNPLPPATTPVNCQAPYDLCWGNYCPDKYCDVIKSFVDIKATMILRAAGTWGSENEMRPGTDRYVAMEQFIRDVNKAYDCAQIRRPVIQGGIYEFCSSSVNSVPIPADIITRFMNEPGFEVSYYLNNMLQPKAINFTQSRINDAHNHGADQCPDISKIEARMWFFYLSKMYIDLGYKSIHMGQYLYWGYHDSNRTYLNQLLNKIRAYAQSKNTFVLMTEENYKGLKYPGTNNFAFDFDTRALRPREVSAPQVCGDFNCNTPIVNYLPGTPCAAETRPAVLDECVIGEGMPPTVSGYSPTNGCFLNRMPYNTYFDFGGKPNLFSSIPTDGCANTQSTWGVDDTKWFSNLSPGCREFWMTDAICRIRSYFSGAGFMTAPGKLTAKMEENYPATQDISYLLADEPNIVTAINTKWGPINGVSWFIDEQCVPLNGFCTRFPPTQLYQKQYNLVLSNPDCSTIYTWHIQNPDGSWQPYTYGNSRLFVPTQAGVHNIYIRQDNLGGFTSDPGYFGVRTDAYSFTLSNSCCTAPGGRTVAVTMDELATSSHQLSDLSSFNAYIQEKAYYTISMAGDTIKSTTDHAYTIPLTAELFKLYPNPAQDEITVAAIGSSKFAGDLAITDMAGRILKTLSNQTISAARPLLINIASLTPGSYIVSLISNNASVNIRFAKY